MREEILARIMRRVVVNEVTGCWECSLGIDSDGYSRITINKKVIKIHRIMFEANIGTIPGGLCVLHKCDVRRCINPDHLFLGTSGDNNTDRSRKGRTAKGDKNGQRTHPEKTIRGERHHKAKLTERDVREIVILLRNGSSQTECANMFGVDQGTVSYIAHGKSWSSVTGLTYSKNGV